MRPATSIGIREFKAEASAILRRAQAGEQITVTDRGHPIARLGPIPTTEATARERLDAAIAAGRLTWSGGKPRGLQRPVGFGASVSAAVVEDRR